MKSLEVRGLKLEISENNDKVTLLWKGKSRHMNPEAILNPYFEEILADLKGKTLTVNFSELKTMNSSTVPPILTFIRNLEEQKIKTTVKYAGNLRWQCASFVPLGSIICNYKFVTVQAN